MSIATATAAKVTYRKTQKGEWVAFGPASTIKAGARVIVRTKAGEQHSCQIARAGRPFTADGELMVYGYIDKSVPVRKYDAEGGIIASTPRSDSGAMCDECGKRRAVTTAYDLSGIAGQVCGRCKNEEGSLSFC